MCKGKKLGAPWIDEDLFYLRKKFHSLEKIRGTKIDTIIVRNKNILFDHLIKEKSNQLITFPGL